MRRKNRSADEVDLRPDDVTVLRSRFGRVRGYRVARSALRPVGTGRGGSIAYLDEGGRTVVVAVRDLWARDVYIRAFGCNIEAVMCRVDSGENGRNAYLTKRGDAVLSAPPRPVPASVPKQVRTKEGGEHEPGEPTRR